jgi:Spy/CpxP family protein refolding chaperone
MKAKRVGTIVMVLALAGIVGFASLSFADGYGRGGRGGGPGNCPRGFGGGPGFGGDLTDEEITALQKERQAFGEQTRELRDKIYQKNLELRSELAKQSPDGQKAAGLQKELSGLDSQLDQMRLEHQLKMKKENPKLYGRGYGMGFGPGYGRGPGAGRGPGFGQGRGGCGGGPCWE